MRSCLQVRGSVHLAGSCQGEDSTLSRPSQLQNLEMDREVNECGHGAEEWIIIDMAWRVHVGSGGRTQWILSMQPVWPSERVKNFEGHSVLRGNE